MDTITHIIYDSVTKKNIIFHKGELISKCKDLGIDYTKVGRVITGRYNFICERYINPKRKDELIFTLKDFETGEEFECVSNKTIFIHLNLPYNEKDSKYIYELKSGRQNIAVICDRMFYVKERGRPNIIKTQTKLEDLPTVIECKAKNRANQKVRNRLRGRLYTLVRKGKTKRLSGMFELIGCDKETLCEHLESLFDDKMSWSNYGKYWHIDHIKPCFMFDLLNEEQLRECWHYTNLRPLEAKENLSRPMKRQYYLDNYVFNSF
jgi:hypothetical protein